MRLVLNTRANGVHRSEYTIGKIDWRRSRKRHQKKQCLFLLKLRQLHHYRQTSFILLYISHGMRYILILHQRRMRTWQHILYVRYNIHVRDIYKHSHTYLFRMWTYRFQKTNRKFISIGIRTIQSGSLCRRLRLCFLQQKEKCNQSTAI